LSIRIGDESGGHSVSASASDVEAFILQLSELRRQMTPEVARTFDRRNLPSGELDPMWHGLSPAQADLKIILIRHHGIGWLSFSLTRTVAQTLGAYLLSGQTEQATQSQTLQ
jgi:hypothetical protein